MFITIQNFSNVYSEQPFMDKLHNLAVKDGTGDKICWSDCSQIVGTDCYCDDCAIEEIKKLMNESSSTAQNAARIESKTPEIHFFDNGNYHYMSKLWTDRVTVPFTLVVFDHHPDMQPPRFGDILSCGGWVKKVLEENKFVQNVVIIGVADHLIEELQADETAEFANYKDRVTFIHESEIREWQARSTRLSSKKPESSSREAPFSPLSSLVSRLPPKGGHAHVSAKALSGQRSSNIYFSIDKDVLSPADAATNWDQGSLTFEALKSIITELSQSRKILGIDICGERAQEFKPIENGAQTAQEADELNNKLNQELVEFLRCEV